MPRFRDKNKQFLKIDKSILKTNENTENPNQQKFCGTFNPVYAVLLLCLLISVMNGGGCFEEQICLKKYI